MKTFIPDYPIDEQDMNEKLASLFKSWIGKLSTQKDSDQDYFAEYFVKDGFFPYYTHQKYKILFIGRETLDIAGQDWINIYYNAYKNNSIGGSAPRPLNSWHFHKRMFKVAYGINSGFPEDKDIPEASSMIETFGTQAGISFAFMNISKLSHEYADNGHWKSDWNQIHSFINATSLEFAQKEIEILSPDVIITMNFSDKNLFKALGEVSIVNEIPNAILYDLNINNKHYNVIDAWHFSAPNIAEEAYYQPIFNIVQGLGLHH